MNKDNHEDIAISVRDITKTFKIPLESSSGLKQKLINTLKGHKGYREFTPLNDISFDINKGDFFGIVGRNGSGKSTLLKTIAGIYSPNRGAVTVNGTLVPFIELGVGFNPELTGKENVYLNGALLGFSHGEMEVMYDDIVEFAELQDFMEERLKNYSSGMQVRLAFSIAIRAEGDILLLDEVLAVGDEAFQRKCYEYFAQLKNENKTVILVTHDMGSIQRFCSKALLLESGKIIEIGDITKVTEKYQYLNSPKKSQEEKNSHSKPQTLDKRIATTLLDEHGKKLKYVTPRHLVLKFNSIINTDQDVKNAFFGFTIRKENGEPVYWYTTEKPNEEIPDLKASQSLAIELEIQNIFGEGKYFVNVSLKSNDRTNDYIVINNVTEFTVSGYGRNGWMLHPTTASKIEWSKS